MVKAVIFDMDGLMIDSEPIQSKAFEEVIKLYGKEPILDGKGIVHKTGLRSDENWMILKEKYALPEKIEVLGNKRRKIYLNLLKKNIKPFPGLKRLIKLLKRKHIKMAIASSSILSHILFVIETLNIKSFFDVIISGQDILNSKPEPEIFLKTRQKLKINPKNCLVLEDSENGVIAAKKAGMKVIAIPNKITKDQDFTKADFVVKSLLEIDFQMILEI